MPAAEPTPPGQWHGEPLLQPCRQLDLSLEPLRTQRVGQLRMEDLQSNRAASPEIMTKKHGGHAAVPKLPLDPVAICEAVLELLE